MSATVETIALLKSIDASLKDLLALSKLKRAKEATANAPDADLDSQYGNPEIKAKDPRDWTGPSMIGKRFSECPATYLDLLAERYDYVAGNEADEKKRNYVRLDAARARGWAARVRVGYKPAAPKEPEGFPSDAMTSDDIQF